MNICELIESSSNTQESSSLADKSPGEQQNQEPKSESNDSESKHDDDEDSNVYNRMIMFVNSNEEYGDQENSTSTSHQNQTNQFSILSSPIDEECQFDLLNPIEKFFKLCENPIPPNMETASKYVVPALEFASTQEEYSRVFSYLRQYCFYSDLMLRSLWLDQIQNVIQYLHQEMDNIRVEFTEDFNLPYMIAVLITDLIREQGYQVKKCASTSILYIIEKQLLTNAQIEQLIIQSILNLVKENNEDFHIDCVALFGKLAPLLGQELTSKYFLDPFCRLSSSPVFHTRKACAANIVEIANVVTSEEVEEYLLPHFCEFMKDQVWAIRKVCADSFSQFATRCRRKIRETLLTEHFIRLLEDNSRWVKISAYKSLGPFIATFIRSEAEKNELANQKQEEINKKDSEDIHMADVSPTSSEPAINNQDNTSPAKESGYSDFMFWRVPPIDKNVPGDVGNRNENEETRMESSVSSQETAESDENKGDEAAQNASTLPSITDPTITDLLMNTKTLENQLYRGVTIYSSTSNLNTAGTSSGQFGSGQRTSSLNEDWSNELKQDIVPPNLLGHFISMVEINSQNNLDSEMNYNCAFNFPAIALTLGVEHWKYIKELYKKLAEDVSWKVRQTLAYSIHELALILGTENTQTDLVPIFDSYIKDVDEVRIGIVANLTKFLAVLSPEYRCNYMPKLNDFLKMDNQRNWRFRNELGLQIAEFCPLFPPDCLAEFVQPVAFTLALDKISEVRLTAINALIEIFKQFESKNKLDLRRNFVEDVIRTFGNSNRWTFRQLYVIMCENMLRSKDQVDFDAFCRDFLPKLFSFRSEKVPNIRLLLARLISNYLVNNDYFLETKSSQLKAELELTIAELAKDKESDVRSFFTSDDSNNNNIDNNNDSKISNDISMDIGLGNDKDSLPKIDSSSINLSVSAANDQDSPPTTMPVARVIQDGHDDDGEEWDEVVDKTKIDKLKIVNLENDEMDDEMDIIIESKEAISHLNNEDDEPDSGENASNA